LQKIQYAKTISDAITKADGTYIPKEKRKKQEEKGKKLHRPRYNSPTSSMTGCIIKPTFFSANAITHVSFLSVWVHGLVLCNMILCYTLKV
jgi:hypothetical protein